MSLYSIATTSLTTHDDRRRRPAIDPGQVRRTLALCLVFAIAVVVMVRHGHAQRDGAHAAALEEPRPASLARLG